MKRSITLAAVLMLAATAGAYAQEAAQKASSANAATMGMSSIYNVSKGYLLKAADQIPADKYGFQPTKDVRTIGQLIGHVADAQHYFCSTIEGKPSSGEQPSNEKLATKDELVSALKKSFDYCDAVLAKVPDADLVKPVTLFGRPANIAAAITVNASHNFEHYGNLVTYMRMNGMIPPSSAN